MNKFDELIEELHDIDYTQKSIDWMEDLPKDTWEKFFKGQYKEVAFGLEVSTHRWYETSTTVYEMYNSGRYLGVNHVTNLFSESMDVEDCYADISFFEMKPIKSTTYEKI